MVLGLTGGGVYFIYTKWVQIFWKFADDYGIRSPENGVA